MPDNPANYPSNYRSEAIASWPQIMVEMQASMAVRVVFTMLINAAILAAMLALFLPFQYPLIWFLAVVVALLIRTLILSKLPVANVADSRKLRLLVVAFVVSGSVQGGLALFLPHIPPLASALVLTYISGICAATVPGSNGYFPAYFSYLCVCLLPNGISMMFFTEFSENSRFQLALLISFPVMAAILLAQAKSTFQVFRDSYSIRLERLKMNSELADALRTAELANAAKTRFLASASHDLRQPIHALSLFSAALSMQKLEPKTKRIADQIDTSINTISSQLDVLLDISKLDAGVVDVEIVNVDVTALVSALASEFTHLAERKGLVLETEIEPNCFGLVDRMLLERALRNLIANAVKYTNQGNVTLKVSQQAQGVAIEVLDTGFGIAEDKLPLIFDEFYQVDNPERDREKGLGLGLSIVKRICELIKADIDVQSTNGVGSRFTLTVPLGQQESLTVQALQAVEKYGESRAMQILVLDDERSVREGMAVLLESLGYEVALAGSTDEALTVIQSFTPDIALLDFRLRAGDSAERALRSLRKQVADMPAVIITGDGGPEVERVSEAFQVRVIHKPVSLELLQKTLHEVLPDDEDL